MKTITIQPDAVPTNAPRRGVSLRLLAVSGLLMLLGGMLPLAGQVYTVSLEKLVTPSTVLSNPDGPVPVPLYAFIEFENLWAAFGYIDQQAGRWQFDSAEDRQKFADSLFRRVVESRVVSMTYSHPHEVLMTHTEEQLEAALETVRTSHAPFVFRGNHWSLDRDTYRQAFLNLRRRWEGSLNCWSAGPSIAERVLSNWYIIREGIELYGATYDSTEHFWQAVKYHPRVMLPDVAALLAGIRQISWDSWLERLSNDQDVYLQHTYAIEFLRQNLSPVRLQYFSDEIARYGQTFRIPVRELQQRSPETPWKLRFTALDEKVLWGDLADVLHLLFFFSHLDGERWMTSELDGLIRELEKHHFDAIYLDGYAGGKFPFISREFRQLMLDIWHVKFLQMKRFREVLLSTGNLRLLHYLNDGDSPDIPIPVYVGYLEEIRRLARSSN